MNRKEKSKKEVAVSKLGWLGSNKKEKMVLLVCSTIIFFLNIVHIQEMHQIIVLNDEFGYWSIAASLAGKNWGELISNTPYYGYGYSILLIPLFYLKCSMSRIYKIALLINITLLIGSFLISVYCGKKLLSKMNKYVVIISALLISFYPNTVVQAKIAWTETLLYFLFWVVVMLLIKIDQRPRVWNITLFVCVLSYMFMVHQRTIGIIIAGGVILIILLLTKKIQWKQLGLLCILLILILSIHIIVKSNLKEALWSGASIGNVNDFSGQVGIIPRIFSVEGMRNLFFSAAGRAYYFLISGAIVGFLGIWKICSRTYKNRKLSASIFLANLPVVEIFVMLSFLSAVAIGIIAMLGSYERLDVIVYGRYMENTIGPILLIGFGKLFSDEKLHNNIFIYFILLICCGWIVQYIMVNVNSEIFNSVCSVGLGGFFYQTERVEAIYKALIFMVFTACLIYWGRYIKIKKLRIVFISTIIIAMWMSSARKVIDIFVLDTQNRVTEQNEELSYAINDLDIEELYYVKDDLFDEYCANMKYLQYWMSDTVIHVIDLKHWSDTNVSENAIWVYEKGSEDSAELFEDMSILAENDSVVICTQK